MSENLPVIPFYSRKNILESTFGKAARKRNRKNYWFKCKCNIKMIDFYLYIIIVNEYMVEGSEVVKRELIRLAAVHFLECLFDALFRYLAIDLWQ